VPPVALEYTLFAMRRPSLVALELALHAGFFRRRAYWEARGLSRAVASQPSSKDHGPRGGHYTFVVESPRRSSTNRRITKPLRKGHHRPSHLRCRCSLRLTVDLTG
jgi:hypothetical protein